MLLLMIKLNADLLTFERYIYWFMTFKFNYKMTMVILIAIDEV